MKRSGTIGTFVAVGLALSACQDPISAPSARAPGAEEAPWSQVASSSEVVPGRWIVVFRDDAAAAGREEATVRDARVRERVGRIERTYGARASHVYTRALRGFAGHLSAEAAAALRNDPAVAFVEPERIMRTQTTQTGATWGIDRVDQRALPLSGSFTYTATGAGVRAYIIDTGIRFDHREFGGRAVSGFDAVDGGTADDCNGHGTHVAGTVGGATYGVAKGATLVGVRVLGCDGSGTNAGVIAGIDWVTADHAAGQPAVANMSLGGGASAAVDAAVRNSIADGVTYAVAAGNGILGIFAANACNFSPARVAEALTVSATNNTDTRPSWANIGTCVDLFAPGVSITSSWHTSATATNTISGTSMATPHVAGVAALYLQGNAGASPSTVAGAVVAAATTGVGKSPGSGSPNRLLFSNY